MTDTYKTITQPVTDIIYKDKSSKFIGYLYPITTEEEVKMHLEAIKKEHFSARHWCYAYQLGKEQFTYRANDDGEPSGTAGLPIYRQIQSFELTNCSAYCSALFWWDQVGCERPYYRLQNNRSAHPTRSRDRGTHH